MSQLRKEYLQSKKRREDLTTEAAYQWVEQNVILINEQIDRRMIKRLIGSITKFDQTFGPYKSKIPALASLLDTAEENLQKVLTGKMNETKASNMLKRLGFLYSSFSRFFSRDLPVLMSSHLFSAPRENPEVRLDVLQPPSGGRYDALAIRDAFKHALTPSNDDQKLIKKIYNNKDVPLIDTATIANQLIQLSFHELEELANIGKIPMVATPEEKVAKESVDFVQTELLSEAIDENKLKELNKQFKNLKTIFAPYKDKMPKTNEVLETIDKKINDTLTSWTGKNLPTVAKLFNKNVEADILNAYEQIKTFNRIWPQLKERLGDDYPKQLALNPEEWATNINLTPEQEDTLTKRSETVRKLIEKAVSASFFSWKKSVIPPTDFTEEIMSLSIDELDAMSGRIKLPETSEVDPTGTGTDATGQSTEKTGRSGTPDQAATGTTATGATGTGKTQPGGPSEAGNVEAALSSALNTIGATGVSSSKMQDLVDALDKAGFTLTPKA